MVEQQVAELLQVALAAVGKLGEQPEAGGAVLGRLALGWRERAELACLLERGQQEEAVEEVIEERALPGEPDRRLERRVGVNERVEQRDVP